MARNSLWILTWLHHASQGLVMVVDLGACGGDGIAVRERPPICLRPSSSHVSVRHWRGRVPYGVHVPEGLHDLSSVVPHLRLGPARTCICSDVTRVQIHQQHGDDRHVEMCRTPAGMTDQVPEVADGFEPAENTHLPAVLIQKHNRLCRNLQQIRDQSKRFGAVLFV